MVTRWCLETASLLGKRSLDNKKKEEIEEWEDSDLVRERSVVFIDHSKLLPSYGADEKAKRLYYNAYECLTRVGEATFVPSRKEPDLDRIMVTDSFGCTTLASQCRRRWSGSSLAVKRRFWGVTKVRRNIIGIARRLI